MNKKGAAKDTKEGMTGLRVTIDRLFYDETGQIIVSALFGGAR